MPAKSVTGQTALTFTGSDGESLDLILDWRLEAGRPASLNVPAEDPEIVVENGWIEDGPVLSPIRDDLLEALHGDADFMQRLLESAEASMSDRAMDHADLQMGM